MFQSGLRCIGPALALLAFNPAGGQIATPSPGETVAAPVKPVVCLTNYPADAIRDGKMGTVAIVFRVLTDGHIDHIAVAASSGSVLLDSATVGCAKSWIYRPATKNGHAVNATTAMTVGWLITAIGETTTKYTKNALMPLGPIDECLSRTAVHADKLAGKSGVSIVRYRLTAGAVSNVTLKQSSGDDALDQEALACVAGWRFEPQLAIPTVRVTGTLMTLRIPGTRDHPPTEADIAKYLPKDGGAIDQTAPDPQEPDKPATGWSTAWIDWHAAVQ
jgi:TonB family protein